jgi:hypothetical protein
MDETPFPTFVETHGPAIARRPATKSALEKYAKTLPQPLLDQWRADGWAGYARGLLWFVDPDELADPLKEWLTDEHQPAWAFARTAFGDLLFWHNDTAYYLHVLYDKIAELTDDLELLFEYTLCKDSYLDKVVDRNLFEKVLPRLGAPHFDECYAFEPAIALGGSGQANTVQKAKLREHLSVLAQLA